MVIYDSTGTVVLDIEVDDTSVRYKAIKGDDSLTLKFSLAEHIEVAVGSYCIFKGTTYTLMAPEDLTLKHRRSFEYSLVMYSQDAKAKRYKFVNPVDGRLKFSLTAKPVEHLQMFVDNMNKRDGGWSVGECVDHVEIVLSYNHTSCHDALVQLADQLELDYWFDGKVVNLGKLELNKDNPLPLSYGGDGQGLKSDIKRTNYADALPIEVLFVQGSSTNIDPSKYGASELHLPKSQTIGFDGTFFEDEDSFNASDARYYKTDANGYSVQRSDKDVEYNSEDSLDCTEIEPTKEETVASVIEADAEKHFYDLLFESNVDYSEYVIAGENATIVFQSGMLAGKEFDLATDEDGNLVCRQQDGMWRVEIVPQDIDGITMPDKDSGYLPAEGNTFKVFGIQLPDEYISDNDTKSGAEWDMFRYAVKHLYQNEDVQYTVSGTLDELYAKRNWDSIKDRLVLGSYISFSDKSFQPEPLLIRIIGIKEYVNKPYSPVLEISNAAVGGTLIGTVNRIENQEVQTEDLYRQSINYTKRRWRDAKQTITMLEAAMTNFSEGINPVTVETMAMLVGDEKLQFIFTESLDSDTTVDFAYTYDDATGIITLPEAFVKHMTLGIDSISPVHTSDEYRRWQIPTHTETLDKETGYYIYVKVSKENATGEYVLSAGALSETDTHYHLLVGILNSSYDGARSFARMHGFTEVLPGQITTDTIKSADGNTWLDLLKGLLHLNDTVGLSGTLDESKGQQSIAAWFGGKQVDKELDEDTTDAAKSIIRHDGTGYFADGLFSWDKDTGLDLGKGQMKINYDGSIDFGGNIRIGSTGEETLDSLLTIVAGLADMWQLDSEGNVWTDRPVYSTKQIAAGGPGEEGEAASGTVNAIQVGDTLYEPVDGIVTLPEFSQGEGGATALSGLTDVSLSSLANQDVLIYDSASGKWKNVPQSSLVPSLTGYATQAWVQEQGYLTSAALDGYATQEYVTGLGYITATSVANTYATKTALAAEVSALNTAIDGKQDKITDLATIRSNAANGNTAYGWGNHADAGYAKAADLTSHIDDTDNPHSVTKAQVGLGNVENTALSTWTGSTKLTTLGTITTGTWNGGKIANTYLANSAMTINGTSVSLGGSFTTASVTAGTAGTSSATSGYTLAVPYVTVNRYGIVTEYGTHTHTVNNIPNSSLVNSKITIAGNAVSLGGSISATALTSSLNLDALIEWYNSLKDYLTYDGTNAAVKIAGALYATGQIAAGGVGEEGDEGTGSVILDYDSIVDALGYTPADESDLASAVSRIVALEGGSALSVTTTGSGNVVTAVSKSGTAITVTKGITALTSHQTIYSLTMQAGAFSGVTYTPNSGGKTVNIPTTTSHISEGDNLYFTSARAVSAVLGSSPIGTTSAYPYWTGTAWATKSLGTFAFKSSLAFSELTSKPTTIAGYGITDAYTASTIDTKLSGYLPMTGGILTGALTIGNGTDLTLKASSSMTGDAGDLVFKSYDETEIGRIWLDANTGSFRLRYGTSDTAKNIIHSGNIGSQSVSYATNAGNATTAASCTGNAATATKLATARTIWGQSFDGSGNVSGALSEATTISASSVICGTESIRVNAAYNAGNFGYMRVETVDSNRGLVHIGANYGGSTTITNTSVRVDAIGLYRGVVGIGRTYTYDELYANQSAGKSLQVDGSTQITGNLCVGASYTVDGTAGAAGVVIRSEGGIEISHTSTPYIDFHYANSTSDHSVRLINKASNTLNLYGSFCGGTNETYSLGTSSLRWHTLHTSYINAVGTSTLAKAVIATANITASTIATADITTLKIGSATLTYDSTAGALKIDGSVYATGQVAAGEAGAEGTASAGGPVTIDMRALSELVGVQDVTQTTMDALGLTQEVAGNMLDGIYTKVVYTVSNGRECWSYDAYETAFSIRIFIRQGDTFDVNAGYSLTYDRQAGTWYTIMGEI